MKKILFVVLALVLPIGLCGCEFEPSDESIRIDKTISICKEADGVPIIADSYPYEMKDCKFKCQ